MISDRELFELRNGRVIMDEDLSEKMYILKEYHTERADWFYGFSSDVWSAYAVAITFAESRKK